MISKRISTLIFDLGGTLYRPLDFTSSVRLFLDNIGANHHRELTDDELVGIFNEKSDPWLAEYMIENNVGQYWNPPAEIWTDYNRIFLENLGVTDNLDELTIRFHGQMEQMFAEHKPALIESCSDALRELKDMDFRLAIASNRPTDPRPFMEEDGILSFFEVVDYTDVPGYKKPSPYMLLKVADRMQVNPRYCAYIGNSVEMDVQAATRADMLPILLSWCDPDQVDLAPEGTIIASSIHELVEYVKT